MAVLLLKKHIPSRKWVALLLLTIGVAVVQLSDMKVHKSDHGVVMKMIK